MRILSLALVLSLLPFSPARAWDETSSRSISESRETLLGILDQVRGVPESGENAELISKVPALARSYRLASSKLPAGSVTIADGPYLGLVLGQKIDELYAAAYDSAYVEQYEKFVGHPELEFIFDQFISSYLDGTLPPELMRSASSLGRCLAYKVQRGKSPGCVLDGSERIARPGKARLLWAKTGCHLPWPSACATRQLVYNEAKEQLVQARRDHALEGAFKQVFPKKFREEFLKEIAARKQGFAGLAAHKFNGQGGDLWGERAWLVEPEDARASLSRVSLRGFAQGLRADVGAAELMLRSTDPRDRADGGALFFAAANRLLLLSGGREALWDGKAFAVDPSGAFDPAQPKAAPRLLDRAFGGWGLEKGTSGVFFSPWDWAAYDPTRAQGASALRILPAILDLGPRGVPAVSGEPAFSEQRLGDLAELLSGLSAFLRATRPDGAFGRYFVAGQDFTRILDPESPALFPAEGRKLAVGIAAGVLKNLVAPGSGHLEQTQPGTPEGGLGLRFHDLVRFEGRSQGFASLVGVSRLLLSASDLRGALAGDPDAPAELVTLLPQLDQALQAGALSLGAQGQFPDGGFGNELVLPQSPAQPATARELLATVEGLRAMTRAYESSRMLVLKLSIKLGWQALERFWAGAAAGPDLPMAVEGQPGSIPEPAVLWEALRLWAEAQPAVRSDLASDLDWARWERRMGAIRSRLTHSLRNGMDSVMFGPS